MAFDTVLPSLPSPSAAYRQDGIIMGQQNISIYRSCTVTDVLEQNGIPEDRKKLPIGQQIMLILVCTNFSPPLILPPHVFVSVGSDLLAAANLLFGLRVKCRGGKESRNLGTKPIEHGDCILDGYMWCVCLCLSFKLVILAIFRANVDIVFYYL